MSEWLRRAAVGCCVVILLLTSVEILLRILGMRFLLSYEYCGFLLAAVVFLMLPSVTQREEHISVMKPSATATDWLTRARRLFGDLLTAAYLLALAWFCTKLAIGSYEDGARSQGVMLTPVYIPQIAMVIGVSAAALVVLRNILRRSFGANRKDAAP